ncbi:MAG: hypothetical protein ACI971_000915 [Colwellia sp.]|jgi:hypothetical protein
MLTLGINYTDIARNVIFIAPQIKSLYIYR